MKTAIPTLARSLHRWFGIALGSIIVLAGATGTALVFEHELDDWLNADLHRSVQAGPPLALSALQQAIESRYPAERIRRMQLDGEPGQAMLVELVPRAAAGKGASKPAPHQIWIDPGSGATLGERQWGAVRLNRRHFMPFVYRLHRTLLLDDIGKTVTGVIALLWFVSSLVGVWLAWPKQGKWRQALTVKSGATGFRLQYDLHRAAGLLTAPVFVLVTFSAVYFNLDGVVKPAVNAVSALSAPPARNGKPVAAGDIAVAPEQALALAQARYGDSRPWRLIFDQAHGAYRVDLFRPSDIGHSGNTRVFVDMRAPRLLGAMAPELRSAGDSFLAWQFPLHTGQFLGLGGQLLWCLAGLVPLLLMVTGITVWLKKRRSARVVAQRRRLPGMRDAYRA